MNPTLITADATPELAGVTVGGVSREAFLVKGVLAAGAVYGAGMVSPFLRSAFAQEDMGDIDILNFALTLEFLEAAFYKKAADLKLSSEVKKIAMEFGDAEQQHVEALRGTIEKLGGKPVTSPTFSFPVDDEKSFLKLAQTLEDTGVSAYNGAGPSIKSKEILAAAGSIVQIEARHAAVIRMLRGNEPAPVAFDAPLKEQQVLDAVKPLITQ